MLSLQEQYAKNSICYGCGPANAHGLQLQSRVEGDLVVALFEPQPHHHAFPDVLNGGVIATILDCHCNWAACWFLMQHGRLAEPPCTVTAEMHIKLKKPTPMAAQLELVAQCQSIENECVKVSANLLFDGIVCDTFIGTFVAVKPNHPAFHRC